MYRSILFTFILLISVQSISAQKKELMVRKDEKNLYLDHKVVSKETFYSIGRLYNLHPKTIASYNKLNMEKGLNIDQKIRIPLTDSNFSQKNSSGTPVYYKVKENEGLIKVSSANRDVSLENLRKWNNLSNDNIREGANLIVGFLVSKEIPTVPTITTSVSPTTEPVTKKEEEPVVKTEEKPVVTVEEKKPEVKEEAKQPEKVVVKEETKPVTADPGYFKPHFDQQVKKSPTTKNETVTAGIFKTSSGWQDGKYYLLIDKVLPGTIIKVINPANNTFIFAKVLGEMSGIRQNEGLNIRISNAAASVLKVSEEDKFIVKVVY